MSATQWSSSSFSPFSESHPILAGICTAAKRISFGSFSFCNRKENEHIPPPNNLLNYGYALLRSYMARAVMDAGLLPSVGVFHCNYFNSFPLVDDVMEPYRPFVDERVFALFTEGVTEIDRRCKQELLEVFYSGLSYDIFSETAHSLAGIYAHTGNYMVYPILK